MQRVDPTPTTHEPTRRISGIKPAHIVLLVLGGIAMVVGYRLPIPEYQTLNGTFFGDPDVSSGPFQGLAPLPEPPSRGCYLAGFAIMMVGAALVGSMSNALLHERRQLKRFADASAADQVEKERNATIVFVASLVVAVGGFVVLWRVLAIEPDKLMATGYNLKTGKPAGALHGITFMFLGVTCLVLGKSLHTMCVYRRFRRRPPTAG